MEKQDSFPHLKIRINPLLILSQKEFGGIFEYSIKKYFSIETGGGVQIPYSYSWETSFLGIPYVAGHGYTIRTGLRFYSISGIYFNPVFFYRYMTYDYRYYESANASSGLHRSIDEPGIYNIGSKGGDSGTDHLWGERGNETKQVFSFEGLLGKEIRKGKMVIDMYAGFGCRYKFKQKEIFYTYSTNTFPQSHSTYNYNYSPPKEEIIHGIALTIHTGVSISFVFKTSNKPYEHSPKDDIIYWKNVRISYNENDTIGLKKVGEVVTLNSDNVFKKLKKQGAQHGATIILMLRPSTSNIQKGYIERITGIAYK